MEKAVVEVFDTEEEKQLHFDIDESEIQRGWSDFVSRKPMEHGASEEYARGYISAQLTKARDQLPPHTKNWMAQREEDIRIIRELRKMAVTQSIEIRKMKESKIFWVLINWTVIAAAFALGLYVESPHV